MTAVRKRILIALLCAAEFIIFSAAMLIVTLSLFHAAFLAFPLWALLWTLFVFDLIWLITLRYYLAYRVLFSLTASFTVYNLLSLLLLTAIPAERLTVMLIVNNTIQALLIGTVIFAAAHAMKRKIKQIAA